MYKSILLFFCFIFFSGISVAVTLDQQRLVFKQAELFLDKGHEREFWKKVAELKDYPLVPYLEYQWFKRNLDKSSEIKTFLQQHKRSLYASPLRRRWLNHLAAKKQWQQYINNYQQGLGVSFSCQYYWALYNTGKKKQAMLGAKNLWLVGHSQPKACDPLLSRFIKSPYLQQKMIWRRFILAMNNGKVKLAGYLKDMLKPQKQKLADFWLKVHKNPKLVAQVDEWDSGISKKGLIFMYGVKRLVDFDLNQAIDVWDSHKANIPVNSGQAQNIETKIALQLTFDKDDRAYQRMKKLKHSNKTVREWRVRAALLSNDWANVQSAISLLTSSEKNRENWRYWRATAHYERGEKETAKKIFTRLAKERSYYGFLAADHLDQDYQLSDHPIEIAPEALEKLESRRDFQIVREFRFFNLQIDAKRHWWFAIRNLKKAQLLVAAKLAQQWQWDEIAIFTIAKAEYWDDVGLRFPLSYQDQVMKNAAQQQLEPAIVFGLVRRESAFDKHAQSPVGASGLMQIMPQTGKQIAAKLNDKWHSTQILFNPTVNLKYGTYYYKQLLNRFEGNFVLAAAAYNAGPNRVDRWLPVDQAMPADIWIETISYKETRAYVGAILAYAMIYQHRIADHTFKISDFMPDVVPEADMDIKNNTEKLHF